VIPKEESGTRGGRFVRLHQSLTFALTAIGITFAVFRQKLRELWTGEEPEESVDDIPVILLPIHFRRLSRVEVRDAINHYRMRGPLGGLRWSREEYIAYALARPIPSFCRSRSSEESWRTFRFRKHEFWANNNFNHSEVARVLWKSGLVIVNGTTGGRDNEFPPYLLVQYVEKLAPWMPKPPTHRKEEAA